MKKKFVLIIFTLCLILGIVTVCFGKGKNTVISARNRFLWKAFDVSGEEQVICGKDGWLFYSETEADYTGKSRLTPEEIDKICGVLEYIDSFCSEFGAEFCFIAAPDKSTVYPDKMPGRYVRDASGNCTLISKAAEQKGIDAPDVAALLSLSTFGVPLYHKYDTHWNSLGASCVVDYITGKYGNILSDSYTLSDLSYSAENDFIGDLTSLLFPGKTVHDTQYYFDLNQSFRYTSYPDNMMDMIITTENASHGKVFAMRDSFFNAIIPLLSDQAGECFYTRAAAVSSLKKAREFGADIVILEIAERNIRDLLEWSV